MTPEKTEQELIPSSADDTRKTNLLTSFCYLAVKSVGLAYDLSHTIKLTFEKTATCQNKNKQLQRKNNTKCTLLNF